jgi:hypothetical protein
MEGIMASTVRQTYIDMFNTANSVNELKRKVIIYSILPPLEVCCERIKKRNGGKPFKSELVKNKRRIVERNVKAFRDAGFISMEVSNDEISQEDTLDWFFDELSSEYQQPVNEDNEKRIQKKIVDSAVFADNHIESDDFIRKYSWNKEYQKPDGLLLMNKEYFDGFWYFMLERLAIWYKRVVLQQPQPWTDDPILQDYKFTNVLRDVDRVTIYERKNILSKLDEPTDDLVTRKKSVLLNIMIFRTWVKIDTYETIGFLDLADEHMMEQWKDAKKKLLERREHGIINFTAAFYINSLRAVNPDKDMHNKTYNAILMIDSWIKDIDRIYDRAINKAHNMNQQMKFFRSLMCVGSFTAYEWACSIALATRYCKNRMVIWTVDNATNVGPGAKMGMDWIFINRGGMSYYQCILYLRSIWKYEMKRLGIYEGFVAMLPEEMKEDIDLRVIEQSLCEYNKYNKVANGTGRPKERFIPSTLPGLTMED